MGGVLHVLECLHVGVVVVLNRASSLGVSITDVASLGVSITCELVGSWSLVLAFLPRFNPGLFSSNVGAEGARVRSVCELVLGWVVSFAACFG